MNIELPKHSVIIERDIPATKSLIIGVEDKKPNTGIIVYAGEVHTDLKGCKVVFRESFTESITIDNREFLYLRDLESSMFYVIRD